ncbi:restriction endonuclease subunit S [Streptomyces parvus]
MIIADLPPGWDKVSLGDVLLRVEAGKSFKCEPRQARDDEWAIIKVSAMTWGRFDENENKAVPEGREINPAYEIKAGDILVSRANTQAYVGAPVLVGKTRERLLLSDKSLRLVPSSAVDRRWLLYFLSSPAARRFISKAATGTKDSMRNISQKELLKMPLALPPIGEQRRIVEVLDGHLSRIDSAVQTLKNSRIRAANLRRAAEQLAISGRLVESGPLDQSVSELIEGVRRAIQRSGTAKQKKFSATLSEEFSSIPAHWERLPLGALCLGIEYGSSAKAHSVPAAGDVPVLRMGNIQDGVIVLDSLKYLPRDHEDVKKLQLSDGDLLFNRTNSAELVGKSAVYRADLSAATFASYLIRCRLAPGIEPDWVNLCVNSMEGRRYINSVVTQQVGQANVNGTKLGAFPIPVPPHGEQLRILASIRDWKDTFQRSVVAADRALQRAGHLRKALLAHAFAGGLTSREPADRIATEGAVRDCTGNPLDAKSRKCPSVATGGPMGFRDTVQQEFDF